MGVVSNFLYKQKEKSRLRKVFKSAGLYHKYKNGDKEIIVYPKIHSVDHKEGENKTEITFTLLNGMSPVDLKKKEFVFQQIFGKQIKIDGDLKKFVLNIYHKPLPKEYKYKFDEFYPYIKNMKLPFVLGRNINGQIEVIDLVKIPHPLVAGETGSGKSSLLRVALTTLIKLKKPSQLQMYLCDLKKSEFSIFKNVEIVKGVYYKPKDIKKMLQQLSNEMDRRSDLTEMYQVNHIDDLPDKVPYIIVAIDEFVRLKDDKEIQDILIDIVSIGRTLGVIALLSMQRPSSDILDTSIRAQLTARIAFQVEDKTNARIIGAEGAEKIKDAGIMKARIKGELKDIKAPLLDMEDAKYLLSPFCVVKGDLQDITEVQDELSTKPLPKDSKRLNQVNIKPDNDLDLFLWGDS